MCFYCDIFAFSFLPNPGIEERKLLNPTPVCRLSKRYQHKKVSYQNKLLMLQPLVYCHFKLDANFPMITLKYDLDHIVCVCIFNIYTYILTTYIFTI